jgi:hypothetical protein
MTYDSASALSAASGQLQQRATAANPLALKPWVVPIKPARSPELAQGSDGSNRCRFVARRFGSSGALSTSALAGLKAPLRTGCQPMGLCQSSSCTRADEVSQPPHGVFLGQLVQYAGVAQAREDVPSVLLFLLGRAAIGVADATCV